MRICVFSDSHGCEENMTNAIRKENPDFMIFLGDGEADFRRVKKQFPAIPSISVAGNTDVNGIKHMEMKTLEGKRILCIHGDRYNIKNGFDDLAALAMERDADIVLFGHTHQAYQGRHGFSDFFNPGPIGDFANASYGVMTIERGRTGYQIVIV